MLALIINCHNDLVIAVLDGMAYPELRLMGDRGKWIPLINIVRANGDRNEF